jgi:cytochrome c-type biogenesis protein CcmH/NrfF
VDQAKSPEVAHQATAIARQTMSPFCPGRTLYDCPSPNAAEWRRDIEAMLQAGKSSPEIQAVLAERASLDLSGSPAPTASYLWPLVGLAIAVVGLVFILRRLRPKRASEGRKDSPPSPNHPGRPPVPDQRLEAELDEVR